MNLTVKKAKESVRLIFGSSYELGLSNFLVCVEILHHNLRSGPRTGLFCAANSSVQNYAPTEFIFGFYLTLILIILY